MRDAFRSKVYIQYVISVERAGSTLTLLPARALAQVLHSTACWKLSIKSQHAVLLGKPHYISFEFCYDMLCISHAVKEVHKSCKDLVSCERKTNNAVVKFVLNTIDSSCFIGKCRPVMPVRWDQAHFWMEQWKTWIKIYIYMTNKS